MKLIAPETAAKRARAALELAPYSREELERRAEERGLRSAAFARIVAKTNPRGFKTIEELWALADACEVPRWFLENGLESAPAYAVAHGGPSMADFTLLEDGEVVGQIEVKQLREISKAAAAEVFREALRNIDPERVRDLEDALVAATRSTKQEAGEGPDAGVPRESGAAANTRDEGDATAAAAQAPGAARPHSEGSTGP